MPTKLFPITIPVGLGGQNASTNAERVAITDAVKAYNVTLYQDTMQKEGGAAKINTTSLGVTKVVGLKDWYDGSGAKFLIAALADGSLVTVVAGGIGATLLAVGTLQADRQTVMVEGINSTTTKKLFIFNGRDLIRFTQGTAATTGTFAATDPDDFGGADNSVNQPVGAVVHRQRMVCWGNENDPHRLYVSLATDHQDYTTTPLSLSVYPGEGERIVAGVSFLGRLYIFKFPFGIYWVDEGLTSDATSVWSVRKLTQNVGMAGPLGLAVVEGDVLFMGSDGLIHALSGVKEFGDARDSAVLYQETSGFLRDHLSVSRLNRTVATWYGPKKECHFGVSESGTRQDRRAVLDLHVPGAPKFLWSDRDVCEAMTTRRHATTGVYELIIGDDNGTVWTLDQLLRDKAGLAYTAEFWTKNIPMMGGGIRRANLVFLDVVMNVGIGRVQCSVEVEVDGRIIKTVTVNSAAGPTMLLDLGLLDVAVLGGNPDEVKILRRRLYGDGHFVRLRVKNSEADQNFSISKFIIWASPGNMRA